MATCIFCRGRSDNAPPEHIIPEALGCPETAVLSHDEVCGRCNNGLAYLDQALLNSLDIPRLLVGQKGKRGRGPFVDGRRNISATVKDGELSLFINAGPGDVTLPNGRVLKAPDGTARSVVATEAISGDRIRIRIRAKLLHDPRLPRALHKIAIEAVAFFLGVDRALDRSLDVARNYALTGDGGPRKIYMLHGEHQEYRNHLWPPYQSGRDLVVPIRLVAFEFLVDLTPAQSCLPRLSEAFSVIGADRTWRVIKG
jgi:hypothetical protein